MYTPAPFIQDNPEELLRFMQANSFATLVSSSEGKLKATHLPLVIEQSSAGDFKIWAHLAKENDQWPDLEDAKEVMVIFQGPHAYISTKHYQSSVNVPTWNYTAVHAYGVATVNPNPEANLAAIQKLVAATEPEYFSQMDSLPPHYLQKLLTQIVAVEISVTRLEGKYKLSQNRTPREKNQISQYFAGSPNIQEQEMAHLMQSQNAVPEKL